MIYLDSETCGLTGPMVLLQYAEDDGPVHLHEVWNQSVGSTLRLIEYIVNHPGGICAYNNVFDWFHIIKIYNCLKPLYDAGYNKPPTIDAVSRIEELNPSKYCLRPQSTLDLMLVARKGKYQYAMDRKPIIIRRIPRILAQDLLEYLDAEVELPGLCFARNKPNNQGKIERWKIQEIPEDTWKDDKGRIHHNPDFVNLKLDFKPSTSLSALAEEVLGEPKDDFPLPSWMLPTEISWHPYGQHGERPWKSVIEHHISMWSTDEKARSYAHKDITLLRRIHKMGFPEAEPGDIDSELTCAIAAARWAGFAIDHGKLSKLREKYSADVNKAPKAAEQVMKYISPNLGEVEKLVVKDTKKETLEHLVDEGSNNTLKTKCQNVLDARRAEKRLTLVDRLLSVPALHPDFKVIGTKSNRKSGGSDEGDSKDESINPQAIPTDKPIREAFPMAFTSQGEQLHGGDAESFEVTIIDAVLPDTKLREDLLSGKKFHALMGAIWHGLDYDDIIQEKNTGDENNIYHNSKRADFAWFYGAQEKKFSIILGKEEEEISETMLRFQNEYREMFERRQEIAKSFCSMRQPKGLGSNVEWHEPADYIESILGFRRYFTLENNITRKLFGTANKLPDSVKRTAKQTESKIVRREDRGAQTVEGALQSALYAAAFGIQASNMRAACNHIIQAPGGEMCKMLEFKLWDTQPKGVAHYRIRTYNMHDELMTVTDGTVDTKKIVDAAVQEFREYVPLLSWEWDRLSTWGDK